MGKKRFVVSQGNWPLRRLALSHGFSGQATVTILCPHIDEVADETPVLRFREDGRKYEVTAGHWRAAYIISKESLPE